MNWKKLYTWPVQSEGEYLRRNPLRFVALITVVSACHTVHDLVWTRWFDLMEATSVAVDFSLLLCFVQKRRIAWLISVLDYVCLPLVNAVGIRSFFVQSSAQQSWEARAFVIALWLAWVGYLFAIRKAYYLYVDQPAGSQK